MSTSRQFCLCADDEHQSKRGRGRNGLLVANRIRLWFHAETCSPETIIGDVIRRVEAPSFYLSPTRDSQLRIIAITQCGRLHRSVYLLQVGITFSGAVVRALLRVLWASMARP